MPHAIYIVFVFALGSCIGSFLNVLVWRLPRVEAVEGEGLIRGFFRTMHALSEPPSHCPKCNKLLKWYDNLPVIGWLKLGGKCRFCKAPISMRYPIIEAITGLMFVGYYVAFFIYQIGPCVEVNSGHGFFHVPLFITTSYWLYGRYMFLLSGLLAASLIDAEYFLIPIEIPWTIAPIAVLVHAWFDHRGQPGSVAVSPLPGALAVGAAIGTVISYFLVQYKIMPRSFSDGAPLMEVEREAYEKNRKDSDPVEEEREWTGWQIRVEMGKEMLFLLIPMTLGLACVLLAWKVQPIADWWAQFASRGWVACMLGSILGGLVGGFTVWFTRIAGSIGFGKEAMGMGDVDLMVAVGAVMGAGQAIVVFFFAPFFGIAIAIYLLFLARKREMPYGPYLSLSAAFVMLFYCPIASYLAPGLSNMAWMLGRLMSG